MGLIQAYKFTPQQIEQENGKSKAHWEKACKNGGFNPHTKKLTPIIDNSTLAMHEKLDALTAAAEAGVLDTDKWVSQLFASTEAFEEFLEEFESYNDCYCVYDRWYRALFLIAEGVNEEGFVTSQEIADTLREVAEETGQI